MWFQNYAANHLEKRIGRQYALPNIVINHTLLLKAQTREEKKKSKICGHPLSILYLVSVNNLKERQAEHLRNKNVFPWALEVFPFRAVTVNVN